MRQYLFSLAVGLFLAAPTLLSVYPPMGDLPHHEAIVGLLAHWGDPVFSPQSVYQLNFGHPNQLWYAIAVPLALLVGATWSCKLTIAASIVVLPLATARASSYFGRLTWFSALVAPLAMGWLYYRGLVTNILGASVLALSLPAIDAHVRRPTWRSTLQVIFALVLLYGAHQSALVAACVAYVIFALPHRLRTVRNVAWLVLPLVAVVALCVWQQFYQQPFLWGVDAERFDFAPLWRKLMLVPGVLYSGHPGEVQLALFALSMGVLVGAIVAARIRRRSFPTADLTEEKGWRSFVLQYQLDLTALALLVLYFAAPSSYHQHRFIFHRFLPFAWMILIIARAPMRNSNPRLFLRIAAAAVPFATLLANWPQFAEAHRIYSGLDPLITMMNPGQAVYVMDTAPREPRLFSVSTAAGHVIAQKGGRLTLDFTDLATIPLRRTPTCRWPITAARLMQPTASFQEWRPRHDFRRFRYLLVHSFDPSIYRFLNHVMADSAKLIGSTGEWLLFESLQQVRDNCAPDEDLELHDGSLAQRLAALSARSEE